MLVTESFPRKLRWALFGPWVVIVGGLIFAGLLRILIRDTSWQRLLALALAIAVLVQVGAACVAIFLLARNSRYRSWMNIALTVAGLIPITYLVVVAMMFGVRLHM